MNRERVFLIGNIIGILVLMGVLGVSIYTISQVFMTQKGEVGTELTSTVPKETIEEPVIETKLHFAFIDSNKSFRSNIDSTNWATNSLESITVLQKYETYSNQILNDLQLPETIRINSANSLDEIKTAIQNDVNIALVPIIELHPHVKTLNYNNIDPFVEKTFAQYPLVTSITPTDPLSSIVEYNPSQITKIGHTGSMVAARWVEKYTTQIHAGDYSPWFATTAPIFATQDITSSTWEAAMLGKGIPCNQCMNFIASEDFNLAVKDSGIDVFSLASNHIMDGGNEGLNRTKELLQSNGQYYLGASDTSNFEALEPILVTTDNLKVAYIAFNDTPGYEQWAQQNSGGAANISDWIIQNGATTSYSLNRERLRETIDRAEALNPDIIVAIAHWSMVEYQSIPTPYVKELKTALVEEGVDIIFGDQTHWVGEIELAQREIEANSQNNEAAKEIVPVFYSVGNYIFDQDWSVETEQGMSVEVVMLKDTIIAVRMYPHQLRLKDKSTVELLPVGSPEYNQTLQRVFESSPNL